MLGYLYSDDGCRVAAILGYDGDGCPVLDHDPLDYDGIGEAGPEIGPADPADEWEDLDPDGFSFDPPGEPLDFDAPDFEDLTAWDLMTRDAA